MLETGGAIYLFTTTMELKIVNLNFNNVDQLYPESGEIHDIRRAWVRKMLPEGFRRKLAFDESGEKAASIEWMPIEQALENLQGVSVNVVLCVFDWQNHNRIDAAAQRLLDEVEQDSQMQGRGIALWSGKSKEVFFERGYEVIEEDGEYVLLLKAFAPYQQVSLIPRRTPQVDLIPGKVVVDIYWNIACSDCAYGFRCFQWFKQVVDAAAAEIGNMVVLREHLLNHTNIARYGIADNIVLINGLEIAVYHQSKESFVETIKELASESLRNIGMEIPS